MLFANRRDTVQQDKKLDSRPEVYVILNLYSLSSLRHGQQHLDFILFQELVHNLAESI